jgi:hypothetical protein
MIYVGLILFLTLSNRIGMLQTPSKVKNLDIGVWRTLLVIVIIQSTVNVNTWLRFTETQLV